MKYHNDILEFFSFYFFYGKVGNLVGSGEFIWKLVSWSRGRINGWNDNFGILGKSRDLEEKKGGIKMAKQALLGYLLYLQ